MKILYVITKSNWGGAQRYVYDLAVEAQRRGHEVAVAAGGTGPLIAALAAAHIRVIPIGLRQRKSFLGDLLTFGALFELLKIVRAEQPDVLHANSAKAGGLGCFVARLAGVRQIFFTAHGWEFNGPRSFLSRAGIAFFSWCTIVLSHKTICVSEAIRRDVASLPFIKNKLLVIHNGVAEVTYLSREDARDALIKIHLALADSRGAQWVGTIAELHPNKGIDSGIAAWKVAALQNAAWLVLGGGREKEKLLTQAAGTSSIHLLDFVPNAAQYLKAFDAFVLPSRTEALGYVLLEAGLASLPAIATRVGGVSEIIEDGVSGILVPPNDRPALARALSSLLSSPNLRAQYGSALHTRVVADFSQKSMLDATFLLYSSRAID